jgi:hypothetical protein
MQKPQRISDKCRKIVADFFPGFWKQSILSSSLEYYTNKNKEQMQVVLL